MKQLVKLFKLILFLILEIAQPREKIQNTFKYTDTYCCCCSKLVDATLIYDYKTLLVFKGNNINKPLVNVPTEDIVCINKRQITKDDVYKFSIHYYNTSKQLKEIKLRTSSKSDTQYWINKLRTAINPKPFRCYCAKGYEECVLQFPVRDCKQFYIKLCHLEYILHRRQFMKFFDYYREKIGKAKSEDNYEEEEEEQDQNNSGFLDQQGRPNDSQQDKLMGSNQSNSIKINNNQIFFIYSSL